MKNLTLLLLALFIFSCKDSLQRKAESLADCPKDYIREVAVKANKSNNVGNPNINFYLSRKDREEHFFYLEYKSRYYFLFYSKNEAGFDKSGLYMDSPYDLLLSSAHRVENKLYGKIKGDPKFYYEISDKEIKAGIAKIMDSGEIVSQDKYGKIIRRYKFCNQSKTTFTDQKAYTNCFVDYYPDYKEFNQILK